MRTASLLLLVLLLGGTAQAQTFSGSGDHATPMFVLPVGVAVFEIEARGPATIQLINERGEVESRLFEAGSTEQPASRSIEIRRAGRFLLSIRSTSEWRVALRVAGGASVDEAGGTSVPVDFTAGAIEGRAAADAVATGRYLVGGFAGGLVLGPIGMVLAVTRANAANTELPDALRSTLPSDRPSYTQAFEEAYRRKLRSDRRTSALVGSAVGTGILAFAIAQWQLWPRSGADDDGDGGGNGQASRSPDGRTTIWQRGIRLRVP